MNASDCPFCAAETVAAAVAYRGTAFALYDKHPVTPGHLLILTRRHVPDWFAMNESERRDVGELLELLRSRLLAGNPEITGFNIGMNCGASAGQTIFHAHIHLIPRRDGDVTDPRGGVRGVVPRHQRY